MYIYLILVYQFVICVILNYHIPLFIFISFFCPSSMAASLPFPTVSLSFSSFSYIQSSSSATGQYICNFINHVLYMYNTVSYPCTENIHACFKFVHFYYYFIFYYFCVVSYAVHSSLMLTWVLVLLLLSISYSSSYNLLFSLNSVTLTQ